MSDRPPTLYIGRRDLIKAGLATGAAALLPWHHARADLPAVARDRTMILVWGGREGRWVDWDLWNPYSIGANHQNGPNLIYEPLAYYSAFADKAYMWLAESYEFVPDFKRLTIKTRPGIAWSDGVPFSAEDVAYTLNTLRDLGPKVRWGVDVQQAVEKAVASDANTVVIEFKIPAPRFFFFMTYKYDIGVYIVPKHIFEGQDWTTFKHFDLSKNWPVSTGPWQVVDASPQQKVFDRRAGWWAADHKLAPLPTVERNISLPFRWRAAGCTGFDYQPARCRKCDAAGYLPDRVSPESKDHHPYRPGIALRVYGLVADLALRQQRAPAVWRQGCTLGFELLHRPSATDRGRLSRRQHAFEIAVAALSTAIALFRYGQGSAGEVRHQ